MLLVVTAAVDATADLVITKLHRRGADVRRFDPGDYPSRSSISLAVRRSGARSIVLRTDEQCVDLQEINAIWFRRPGAPRPHDHVTDARLRRYIVAECTTHLDDVWNAVQNPCFPAAPMALARADLKASQLGLAAALGFDIPPTLITTNPDDFIAFHQAHDGRVVSKLAGPIFNRHFGPQLGRYSEVVSTRDVGHAQQTRLAPTIYQAYVPKRVELRITVVGDRVFAAEIHSQATRRTRHDWRRYHVARTPHGVHALPHDIEQRCVRLVQALGLSYGAIDMVLTPEGRYVFLEINPNGQFLWIEQLTGLPISDAVADWLMDPNGGSRPVRSHQSIEADAA